jgi:hypothetical protein
MAAQCAHIASSRDTGRLARSASRTTIGCQGERTPWEFRGDDFFAESGRVVSSSQQAKVCGNKANLEATLRVRSHGGVHAQNYDGPEILCTGNSDSSQCAIAENADCQNGGLGGVRTAMTSDGLHRQKAWTSELK